MCSVKEIRLAEHAAARSGVSYSVMMERAGHAAFSCLVSERLVYEQTPLVLILCGNGNNGGDGFVIARYLHAHVPQVPIRVALMCGEPKTEIATEHFATLQDDETLQILRFNAENDDERGAFQALLKTMPPETVVLDAVYGIGFKPPMRDGMCQVLQSVYERSFQTTVAIDVPSGMAFDESGARCYGALHPNATITFIAQKKGMDESTCGIVYECDLDIPRLIVAQDVARYFPIRLRDSHKGTFGSVYALCGSYGMAGAAMLCGTAAMRCGAGLVHMMVPESIYPIVAGQLWEAVYHPLAENADHSLCESVVDTVGRLNDKQSVLLVGPGLSAREATAAVMARLLSQTSLPLVLDADGLNALSVHTDVWKAIRDRQTATVITPHPAEAARLLGVTTAEVEQNRLAAVKRLAALCGGVAVLKGHVTLVADHATGAVYANTTGCAGLAKGGSGDVLAGMIASFWASGMTALGAAVSAVYVHGAASVQTASRLSESGMLATDLLEDLPVLLSQFEQRE